MKILTVFMLTLTVCLILFTMELYTVLRIQDFIMMSMCCVMALMGSVATGYIAINSEE
jgi:hypothetical protein